MTSEKKLSILIGGLLVLLAGAVFLWFHGKPATPSKNVLANVDVAQIGSINIETQTSTMTFQQRNGAWSMTQPVEDEVEPQSIDRLVTALKAFSIGSIVSENPDNYDRFELMPNKATHIRVYKTGQEKPVMDGYVGKTAASGSDSFFRLDGKKTVYIAAGLPSYLFKAEPRQYRLAKVFPGDALQSDSVTITMDKKSWTFNRSSDTWTMAHIKNPVSSYEVKTMVASLNQWHAIEFGGLVQDNALLNTSPTLAEITVMRGPVPTAIRINKQSVMDPSADKRGNMHPVIVDGRKYVLAVPAAFIDEFLSKLKSFK